jgi:glycosyltransferase involved in cell wall biosynthesis
MDKFLSIIIPTYNRASELDRQLAWLADEIKGFEHECEIIISDNCSMDDTPGIVQKWQPVFSQTSYRTYRNAKNILGVPNLVSALKIAQGQFVWTIGDDDPIKDGTLAIVIALLKQNPDLALLYLNFNGRDERTDEAVGVAGINNGQWLDASFAASCQNGQEIFEHCIAQSFGAVIFLTATIYRTQAVQESFRLWPESIHNWGGQAFWTGYCATQGRVMITPESYIECKVGVSHWQSENDIWFTMLHRDIPEVFVKLQEKAGYSHDFCRRMVLDHYKATHIKVTQIRSHLKTAKKWPRLAASLLLLLLL